MSPQRVIRPAARRSPAGARSLLWTAAAAALPVIVTVLVLAASTLAILVFTSDGFDSLFPVVAVEWLVLNRVPLVVDTIELGFLPLLPPVLYAAVLARQTRAVLADVEQPGAREAGAAVAGVTVAGLLLTGLATLLVGSAASDFAVRESSLPSALGWTAAVAIAGAGLGVWLYFRRGLREVVPLWVRGGVHLGAAFVAAASAVATLLVLVGLVAAWEPVAAALGIGKDVVGTAALTAISAAYLPNVVIGAVSVLVGGEAHLGQASYSVFAVSRGPMPDVPLAAVLPTTNPHWAVQGLLLVTVVVAAALARSVAHWFRTTGDAVKAAWLAAAIVALVIALSPVVAGGELGVLGTVGTGSLIAAAMGLLLFGIIGSATIALSLAGLTRRRERAESELERRRRRAGTMSDDVVAPVGVGVDVRPGGYDEAGQVDDEDADEADDDDEVDHLGAETDHPEDASADLDEAPDTDTAVDSDPPAEAAAEDPPAAGEPSEEPAGEPAGEPAPAERPAGDAEDPAAEAAEDDSAGLPDEKPTPAD
ncbi:MULTISPECIES: cell division protein PerM [Dietzia]|uniref:cell division protein PerM n=1 Tax=Dietzia TaxID=37914 RepID=UPI0020C39140|nr:MULTISPECIES: DUF6350 family protein [Dietzia]MCT1712553.1 DUF6350 family protein [Dietzia cinnamea]MCT2265260.1 DUF6350 family protein [Dietzia cinnamea]MCT2274937.1 DUF6350 family protein [Dietzia cinnamea]